MGSEDVLSFNQTAAMMGYAPRSWSRHWKAFMADKGFPAPLPSVTTNRRPKWSRKAVQRWIECGGYSADDLGHSLSAYAEARNAA